MAQLKLWGSIALILAVIAAGVWVLWSFELRWRPKTIVRHQAEITGLLKQAGWVSPGQTGRVLYVVSFRACPDCARLRTELLPKLQEKGVDTRVIEIARRDEQGVAKSSPIDRATVAELWLNRNWKVLDAWYATPPEKWTAADIAPADGDMARTAVVEAGRSTVDRLKPLLKQNGVTFAYPLLVWWNAKGEMRACACEQPQTYRFVRRELGA